MRKYLFLMPCLCVLMSSQAQDKNLSSKEIVLRYFNEVVNQRKLELVPNLFDSNFVFHTSDGKTQQVIKDSSLVRFLKYLLRAFPDLQYTIDVVVAEGNDVAVYISATGTHQNSFHGFDASNNKVAFKEIFIFRCMNNKITEGWGIVDIEGLKDQLKKKE